MSRAQLLLGVIGFATGAALCVAPAHATPVTATLSAQYFKVLNNSSGAPDFGGSGVPVVADGSSLGPNGFPVATGGVSSIDSGTGQLEWWSPTLSGGYVIPTGTGTISLPYSSNMYPPNSTGGDDGTAFETAIFKGNFSLAASGTVSFSLGSDDDSFIYVDGKLIGQNPGIHSVTTVEFTSNTLPAGSHSIAVFFADRERVGAALSLSLDTEGVTITPSVPEPVSIALLGAGLAGLGLVRRRRR
jgi:PEP-CTERM motif